MMTNKPIILAKRTESAKRFDLPMPKRAGDCGFDLKCTLEEEINGYIDIKPGAYCDIPTGVFVKLPEGYFAIIMPRSSVFTQMKGLRIHEGVIDNGYTGELKVLAINQSDHSIRINDGDRLAQLILFPLVSAKFVEVDDLPSTERGDSGFGSTGR